MRLTVCVSVVSLLLLASSGCREAEEPIVRDPVSKVTGTLLVDGKPEPMVAIRMVRIDEGAPKGGTSALLTASGFTDAQGRFVIGTYDKGPEGDGAADGKYALTFQWGQISMLGGGRYEGDKFNGKYSDPEKSEHIIEVKGAPVEIPPIDLSTKDVPKARSGLPSLGEPTSSGAASPR